MKKKIGIYLLYLLGRILLIECIDSQEIVEQDVAPDVCPRTDISALITEALLVEISDKNWKTRNEGLIKLQGKCSLNNRCICFALIMFLCVAQVF